jgi:U3 small nucleolar RNA-associated protein 19
VGGSRKNKRKREALSVAEEEDGSGRAARLVQRLQLLHACGRADPVAATARLSSAGAPGPTGEIPAEVTKRLRRAFGDAWLRVLSDRRLTPAQRAAAVAALPRSVIPRMSNPLRLSDFLTDTYDGASSNDNVRVAVAALDALFLLISRHRLDYPDFYPKLYARLTPYALFEAPERERFLSLIATFLTRGAYLPRTMVASYVKRLARRALVAPPAGAMWCLRLALDLLHKHPSVSFLVHKSVNLFDAPPRAAEASAAAGAADAFDDTASDPLATGADRSSLWELDVLRNHMSPAVSRLVDAFSRDVRKRSAQPPPGELEDYASLGFSDVFGAEFKRRAKAVPLAYHAPDAPAAVEMETLLAPALRWH